MSRLSLRGLTKDYGELTVVDRIDLTLAEGEFVSFIGPSGCGKTTLLRVIADLEQPTGGHISVNGVSPSEARLRREYGFIFQAPALYPWRTIERNVELPLEIFGLSRAERRERSQRQLELVNLKGFEKKFPWQLSGGMQQRASIARALSFDPKLLLMDEPFGALDEITRFKLNDDLLRLQKTLGCTVVFVTHSIYESAYLSGRIMVLSPRPGRIVTEIPGVAPERRSGDFRASPSYAALCRQVSQALTDVTAGEAL